jgi:hypothetical protein
MNHVNRVAAQTPEMQEMYRQLELRVTELERLVKRYEERLQFAVRKQADEARQWK